MASAASAAKRLTGKRRDLSPGDAPARNRRAAQKEAPGWTAAALGARWALKEAVRAMKFLATLFWAVCAAALVLFARENWVPVTINLWSGLQADVKLPFLLLVVFLLGFLPTYLVYRGRMWGLRRQLGRPERVLVGNQPVPIAPPPAPATVPPPAADTASPAAAPANDRPATDFSI